MRILILTQYFWPENFRINDLARGLKDKGHEITVLTGIPNYPGGCFFPGHGIFRNRQEDYHGIKVLRVPVIPRGNGKIPRMILNYLSFTLSAGLLAPFLCRDDFDVVFFSLSPVTEGFPAVLLKSIKKIPLVFWVQDLWPESLSATGVVRSPKILRLIGKAVHFIYQKCDKILVQSRAFSSPIEKMGGDPGHIVYFPNSAEELYQPVLLAPDAPENLCMPSGFRVMFAGNIGVAQDFDTILKAAEKLKTHPDIHWVIIGDGRMRPWVEMQVQERDLTKTVHLLGRHPVESMPRYFSLADVMLITLKRDPIFTLTLPSKIQSYLACAKPIIAALDGEGAQVIEEAKAGLSCPAENPGALAEAVLAMSHMTKTERQAMGLHGRHYFERHFERTMLLNHLDALLKELKGKTA